MSSDFKSTTGAADRSQPPASPAITIPLHDRLSIRAVLVPPGADAAAALAAAGIHDVVSIPCIIGEERGDFGGLGTGPSGRVTGLLEMPHANGDAAE